MPQHDLVDVRVLVNGQALHEYPVLESDKVQQDEKACYIEASNDQCFEVSVRWLPGFDLKHATTLMSLLDLDGTVWWPIKMSFVKVYHPSRMSSNYTRNICGDMPALDQGQDRRSIFCFRSSRDKYGFVILSCSVV